MDIETPSFAGICIANAKYTGEKSGWYIDTTILAEAQVNAGPSISAYREPTATSDQHWFTNNGLFGVASVYGTLNFYGTNLDSVDHTDSTIDSLNSTQWRSTKLDGTPIRSSNVKPRGPLMAHSSTASNTAGAFDLVLDYLAGTVQSYANGTDLFVYESNGLNYTTMTSQDFQGNQAPVPSINIHTGSSYGRMYQNYNMDDGFKKSWQQFWAGVWGW